MSTDAIQRFTERIVDEAIAEAVTEVMREDMPQMPDGASSEFRAYAEGMGFTVTTEHVDPYDLRPTQEDRSEQKVESMMREVESEGALTPCVVSREYAIADGHHRTAAVDRVNARDDGGRRLPIIRVHADIDALITLLSDFEKRHGDNTEGMDHVVVHAGRFHPFHTGDLKVYEDLCARFGRNSVYVVTSGRTNPPMMPFMFTEKQRIISKMYPVPKGQIVEAENAYNPEPVLEGCDPETTCFVMALSPGNVEAVRRSGLSDYFSEYSADGLKGYGEEGYYVEMEPSTLVIDGEPAAPETVHRVFSDDDVSEAAKRAFFEEVFDQFDQEIFDMCAQRFNPVPLPVSIVREFVEENEDALNEATQTVAAKVDDGPATWYDGMQAYRDEQDTLAQRMGMQVLGYMADRADTDFKEDALPYASFYPAGDDPNFQPSITDPDSVWAAFSRAVAEVSGMRVIDWLGSRAADTHNRRAANQMPQR